MELMSAVKSGSASGVWTRSTNKAINGGEVIETDQSGDTSGTCQGSTVLYWVRINRCGTARHRHGRGRSRKCRNWPGAQQSKNETDRGRGAACGQGRSPLGG